MFNFVLFCVSLSLRYLCSSMAQNLVQTQAQKLAQQQKLTQQQMLQVRLLEMPLTELEESVSAEIDDNPALESSDPDDAMGTDGTVDDGPDDAADEDFDAATEREERQSALDEALSNMTMDDDMPETAAHRTQDTQAAEYEEMTYGDSTSFYDKLNEQIGEVELTDKQREVMEYLIGSLDADGLLRKPLDDIVDELAIYHNILVSEKEVEQVLAILQTFDPAGIGARSLQECLRLQIERLSPSADRSLMKRVVDKYFDEFMGKRWDKIAEGLSCDPATLNRVRQALLRLNPKPGAALGETEGRSTQQITPDFIVDTADDGTVTFTINNGNIPDLYVSPSFSDMIKEYQTNRKGMNRQAKEALLYAKEKVERAQGYIDAVKQRRHTMYVTMRAIIEIQKRYFQDGDEADLKPMILKDVADRAGLDISTVSRVSNMKYAQTRWGTFLLRHFFSDAVRTEGGEELSTRKVKAALKELIDHEDKHAPLSDDVLKDRMKEAGYPVARRTVAKYREQLGIPVARLRKKN